MLPQQRLFLGILLSLAVGACSHHAKKTHALSPNEAAHAIPMKSPEAAPLGDTESSDAAPVSDEEWKRRSHPDFQWPVERPTVINYYGWRGKRKQRMHEGLDLRAPTGTPLYAAAPGEVIHASRGIRGYGRLVVIDHGGKWSTIYGHLSKFAVKAGRRVQAGDLIGYAGRSGRARGAHLHFEIRKDADPLDPLIFLGNVKK